MGSDVDSILGEILAGPGGSTHVVNPGETLSGITGGSPNGSSVVRDGVINTVGRNGYTGNLINPGDVVANPNGWRAFP